MQFGCSEPPTGRSTSYDIDIDIDIDTFHAMGNAKRRASRSTRARSVLSYIRPKIITSNATLIRRFSSTSREDKRSTGTTRGPKTSSDERPSGNATMRKRRWEEKGGRGDTSLCSHWVLFGVEPQLGFELYHDEHVHVKVQDQITTTTKEEDGADN